MVEDALNEQHIFIGADLVPTASNWEEFISANVGMLLDANLQKLLSKADFTLFNLEVPLADAKTPILKNGPTLIAPTATVAGLHEINPYAFTLANNHILDQGESGLSSTLKTLDDAGLSHLGAGLTAKAAAKPLVVELGPCKVGFYACAEHEFSIAVDGGAGANPFDPYDSLDAIRELSGSCDYVVALYHGGKEHYRYPSPMLQKRCRKLVEAGANLVLCQHSHCVGCKEEWSGGTVVYGQGNFLFDDDDSEFWATGLLVEVVLGTTFELVFHPLVKRGSSVALAMGDEGKAILSAFESRSSRILEPGFIEKEYAGFARGCLNGYLEAGIPGSRTVAYRVINKLSGGKLASRLVNKKRLARIKNYLVCEAHEELFSTGLDIAMEGRK